MQVLNREAKQSDAAAVAEVRRLAEATLRETYYPDEDAIARKSELAPRLSCPVAVAGDRIVGVTEYEQKGDRIHFLGLGVHPDCRRRGVARRLVEHLAHLASRAGAKRLSMYTVRETGNVPIFERMGFEVVREEEARFFKSRTHQMLTDVYMERRLERN